MSVIISNNSGLSQTLDASNIVTFFTSNHTFSALYKDIGGIQTLGDVSGGTLDTIRDRYLKLYLNHISNIPNTDRSFVGEKFYYEVENELFWMQPLNINDVKSEISDIRFYNKTVNKKLDLLENEPLLIEYILQKSGTNKDYYRAHICNTIFKQNPDINTFYHKIKSFIFPIQKDIDLVDEFVHIYRPNQTIHYTDIKQKSVYIPLLHNQEWFEIRTENQNILLQNHLHYGFVIRIYYHNDIYHHNDGNISFRHNNDNDTDNNKQYFTLENSHIIFTEKQFYGFLISKFKIIDGINYNDSFKSKYKSLIRHRPLR